MNPELQCKNKIKGYQKAVRAARFITDAVGYHISYATSALAKHMDDPGGLHFQALKKLLRYLAGRRKLSIRYYNGDAPDDAKRQLEAWFDSDWAQCPDTRRSRTGVVFTYAGDVIHYRSSMQKSVATSSSEAEYVAAGVAAKDLKWLRSLAQEWRINLDVTPTPLQSTKLHIDSSGAIAMSTSNGPTRRSKHVDIQHHFL
jgi:hypothetical protein